MFHEYIIKKISLNHLDFKYLIRSYYPFSNTKSLYAYTNPYFSSSQPDHPNHSIHSPHNILRENYN